MKNKVSKVENQKPFDVVMNEHFVQYQSKGFSRNWFIPIVKEQSEMDYLIDEKKRVGTSSKYSLQRRYPNTLLEVNTDDEGKLSSIYVLYSKGGKLYKVVSQKDYECGQIQLALGPKELTKLGLAGALVGDS